MLRFRRQAEGLCAALAALTTPAPATDFVCRALRMLEATGWIAAHRFLFGQVAISEACQRGLIVPADGHYRLPE